MAQTDRAAKVADRIREVVARRIEKGLRDPRLGFVTITDVKVTGDLQHASVFYTVYGDEAERTDSAAALKAATGMLRTEVGRNLNTRLTPSLEFIPDAIPENAAVIESLLRQARERDDAARTAAAQATYAGDADPYVKPRAPGDPGDSPGALVVRRAVAADADDIARVHIAAWRETYPRLLPPGALDDLDPVARAERWRQIIDDDRTEQWVAVLDGEVVGWASVGSGRDADVPQEVELEGIYVLAAHHGAGVGQALLDAAIGDREAYLWCATENARAQAFYRRNGFADDGTRSEHPIAGHPVPVARFVRGREHLAAPGRAER